MNLKGVGRILTFLLILLVLTTSGLVNWWDVNLETVFLLRLTIIWLIFFIVMLYSPGFYHKSGTWTTTTHSRLTMPLSLLFGLFISWGTLWLEYEGIFDGPGFVLLVIFYSFAAGSLSYPIAYWWRMNLFRGGGKRIEPSKWNYGNYKRALDPKTFTIGVDEPIRDRIRSEILSLLVEDDSVGEGMALRDYRQTSTSSGTTTPGWIPQWEMERFAHRNKENLSNRLLGGLEGPVEEFETKELHDYLKLDLEQEFEDRLLRNSARFAEGNNAKMARNLIRILDLEKLFLDQRAKSSEDKSILQRQMILLLFLFFELFWNRVEKGLMDSGEGKSTLRSIIRYLFENRGPRTFDSSTTSLGDFYNRIEIDGSKVSNEVRIAAVNLFQMLPTLTLSIERLDQERKVHDSESSNYSELLKKFVDISWDYIDDLESP